MKGSVTSGAVAAGLFQGGEEVGSHPGCGGVSTTVNCQAQVRVMVCLPVSVT